MVVFRDRSEAEIRDIGAIRRVGERWSSTEPVGDDEWTIPGCPVNGPAVSAQNEAVVLAWFTAASDQPTVRIAFSRDSGETFDPVMDLDRAKPLGRVGVVLETPERAVVSWLTLEGEEAELRLQRITATGERSEPVVLATTRPTRASGRPQMIRVGERLYVGWVEISTDDERHLRVREIEFADLPEPDLTG